MERIIGLDFGHCEIAAATPVYEGGKFVRIDNLYLDGEKNFVIPAEVEYYGELFNYFKASPEHFDEVVQGNGRAVRRRDLMSAALAKIMRNIVEYNSSVGSGDQILLLVGCPACGEWTSDKNREEYETLIKQAAKVRQVRVVPESRAAMFSALSDGKGRMISAAQGAVVYDLGSLTADCTYMKTGQRCLELSWKLGAREVERALRRLICEEASRKALQKGLELMPVENHAKLERVLRGAKEAYFSGSLDESASLIAYRFMTDQGKKLPVNLDLDDATMERALEMPIFLEADGGSLSCGWKTCCTEFFRRSKSRIEDGGRPVKEIVLTGGASRMGVVRNCAREVFPEDSYTVTCANNPCFSVSQGLVWVGLVDELEEEVISVVKQNVVNCEAGNLSTLKNRIKSNMGEQIYEAVWTAVAAWAASPEDESLKDLEGRMAREIDGILPQIKSANRTCIGNWSDGIIAEIRKQLESELQKSFGPALGQKMKMPGSNWKSVSQSLDDVTIDIDKIISGIDVNSILNQVVKWAVIIVYTLLGTAIFPGVATAVGFCLGVYTAWRINDDDREKPRKSQVRCKVRKAMERADRKREIMQICDGQVDNSIELQLTAGSVEKDIEAIAKRAYEIMTLKFEI